MKKQSIFTFAIMAIALSLASCNNKYEEKKATLLTTNDSLNYTIGLSTGNNIKSYYLAADSSIKAVAALIGELDRAYKSDADKMFQTGKEVGGMFAQQIKNGFSGDSTIRFDVAEAKKGLEAGFKGDESKITAEAADRLIQGTMTQRQMNAYLPDSLKTGIATLSADTVKSLNYALGFSWGNMLKAQKDTTVSESAQLKSLLSGVNSGLKSDPKYGELVQIGNNLGTSLKEMEKTGLLNDSTIPVNYAIIRQGLINGLLASTIQMTAAEADEYIQATMKAKNQAKAAAQYGENRSAGEAFLAENGARPEVVTTPSGLQYEIITQAKKGAAVPAINDKVKVHYHGTLIDGTVFDSSVERGEPVTFGVTQVISGWTEALQLMPAGSKWKLYIPYQLAYGEQGSGQKIAPYSALVFEV
jgi:FKBP-type peptidyl-prolyl cis-trans isomerase FklB